MRRLYEEISKRTAEVTYLGGTPIFPIEIAIAWNEIAKLR